MKILGPRGSKIRIEVRALCGPKENGGRFATSVEFDLKPIDLDDVDLSRQIRGNLEADFLLANRGLHPGLHGSSPWVGGGFWPARLMVEA